MDIYIENKNASKVNRSFALRVDSSEDGAGRFIIHPVGCISTITSPILQKEMQRILESSPEIVLIDMNQVNYINFRGLRVILKIIRKMNQRNGKVCLRNLQPQVKEMFEIMHGILPQCIFEGRKQLEHYLDANHDNCTGNSQWTMPDDADNAHNLGPSKKRRMKTCFGIAANGQ
jgi:anti-anti-sigma factor